jgi:hypothetical protein
MSSQTTHVSECLPDLLQPEKVREVLDRPFPPEAVRTRPGNFGQTLSYIEAHHYITRLTEAFGVAWSFQIVQHEILDQEVLVLGKLTTLGHVRMAFGGSSITRVKETGEPVSIADDLKSAATDSLKKAASFLGIGLHLYAEAPKNPAPKISGNGNGQAKGNGTAPRAGNGNGRLTSRQLDAILAIGKDRGLDREQVRQMALDRFGKNVEFIGKQEASSLIQELSAQ